MEVLSQHNEDGLREGFIRHFVDTTKPYYKERIAQKTEYRDGFFCDGYLWDCMLNPIITKEGKALDFLFQRGLFYVMWDVHSDDRVL